MSNDQSPLLPGDEESHRTLASDKGPNKDWRLAPPLPGDEGTHRTLASDKGPNKDWRLAPGDEETLRTLASIGPNKDWRLASPLPGDEEAHRTLASDKGPNKDWRLPSPLPGDEETLRALASDKGPNKDWRLVFLLPGQEEILRALPPDIGIDEQEASRLSGVDILKALYRKARALNGQPFIKLALFLLTNFSNVLPPVIVKYLNDKVISILYEKMRNPTDLTGVRVYSPDIGKPNSVYARSVPVTDKSRFANPPDVGKIFDQLLCKRSDEDGNLNQKYAGGLSSLEFAFGVIVVHSVFYTDRSKTPPLGDYNKTSSYVDLAPLYGDSQLEENGVRNKGLGRGLLHPDCFADSRMLFLPPASAVVLVIFNRNHNYIAAQLLKENERSWCDPPPEDAVLRAKQDEEIFQTARLLNCRHFVNVVITDYVGGFMGMVARGGGWPGNAEVFHEMNVDGRKISRADGNLVSIEFNIIYQWHATISKMDEEWTKTALGEALGQFIKGPPGDAGKEPDWNKIPVEDYKRALLTVLPAGPVKDRTFAGLKRLPDGHFSDGDLAALLYDATEESAGFFRARGTPSVMRTVDMLGMMQARAWNVCTMNEFRSWLGLQPYKSFEEWNAHPDIANAARDLYHDIDNLELYPGLHAEGHTNDGFGHEYRPLRESTVRLAILFDAIALTRGDPKLTTGFTPETVTNWGYRDVAREHNNKAFGGHIHKILKRTLPDNFPDHSIYTWFPLSTPTFMKSNQKLPPRTDGPWTFDRPISKVGHGSSN